MKKKIDGFVIHRNPKIEYNCIFGKLQLDSPYLWSKGNGYKPLVSEMKISHQGRSEMVNRALSDFGIEESFVQASLRFTEHYHYTIGSSAVARTTQETAHQAFDYLEEKLTHANTAREDNKDEPLQKMLVELDGCEIRTVVCQPIENSNKITPIYGNPVKSKKLNWRDVRLGFVRPLESISKTFVGKMDVYPEVIGDLYNAALLIGMTDETKIIGVSDGVLD